LVSDLRVKVLVFVQDLRLAGHEVQDGHEVFAFKDEILSFLGELAGCGLFELEFFEELLFFFESVGESLGASHGFVGDVVETLFELLFGLLEDGVGFGFGLLVSKIRFRLLIMQRSRFPLTLK
jgi:hypothetical protein